MRQIGGGHGQCRDSGGHPALHRARPEQADVGDDVLRVAGLEPTDQVLLTGRLELLCTVPVLQQVVLRTGGTELWVSGGCFGWVVAAFQIRPEWSFWMTGGTSRIVSEP